MSQPEWWSPAAQYDHNQPPTRPQNYYLPPSAQPLSDSLTSRGARRSGRSHGAKVSVGLAVGMALIAGAVGGVAGNLANGTSLFDSGASFVATTNVVERSPRSIAAIAARVLPSVVSISTSSAMGSGTGTGFVIRSDGYILTNNHVVENVRRSGSLNVSFNDGKVVRGKIVGVDPAYDLAVIKVARTGVPALQFGNSDKVQVGDAVIAIGSPLGLSGTVTSGIISAKNRAVTAGDGESEGSFINALQTDADTGKSSYPVLGISVDTSFAEGGARVASVSPDSPAQSAGIETGDVIIELGGRKITNSDELIVAIRDKAPGDQVSITLKRNDVTKVVKATLVAAQK